MKKEFKKYAVIILSGGMDSVTCLHDYKDGIGVAISFNYGSKHNDREIACAKKQCKDLGIKHEVIDLSFMGHYFDSSLLKGGEAIPQEQYDETNIKSTLVPFRNGIMLSIAAGIAENNGLSVVVIGSHFGDHALYPDCTSAFTHAMSQATSLGTFNKVVVKAPYSTFTKREIALIGKRIGVPFHETYSCYEGNELHCGKCATCLERKEALEGFDRTYYQI